MADTPFMFLTALSGDSLLKKSFYPCVCMCVHSENKVPLVLFGMMSGAVSHSLLQSFPSSDAAISRLLIKRH